MQHGRVYVIYAKVQFLLSWEKCPLSEIGNKQENDFDKRQD